MPSEFEYNKELYLAKKNTSRLNIAFMVGGYILGAFILNELWNISYIRNTDILRISIVIIMAIWSIGGLFPGLWLFEKLQKKDLKEFEAFNKNP